MYFLQIDIHPLQKFLFLYYLPFQFPVFWKELFLSFFHLHKAIVPLQENLVLPLLLIYILFYKLINLCDFLIIVIQTSDCMNSCKRRIFTDLERILYSIGFIFPSLNTLSLMGVKYSSIISLSHFWQLKKEY